MPSTAIAAALLVVAATALGVGAAFCLDPVLRHGAASLLWAAAFLLWLVAYAPDLADAARRAHDRCG